MIGKACQLIPAYFDAEPQFWDRFYSKNMRPIRGYPDYWRIDDTEAFIDGPIAQGLGYVRDLYIWSVRIVRDDDLNLTNTFELTNTREKLSFSDEEVNGETVSTYNYTDLPADFTYTHSSTIDSVSLEFDQLGRRMVTWESTGTIYLYWFDAQAQTSVTRNYGAGYNPFIITDTYRRRGGSGDSERLLFYVDGNTQQIVYRRQLDRFGVVYTLPSAPSNVVELLKVSKNIYGGLTALYCYDDGNGNLLTGSFTAESAANEVRFGTDRNIVELTKFIPNTVSAINFDIRVTGFFRDAIDSTEFDPATSRINFTLRETQVLLEPVDGPAVFVRSTENTVLDNFFLGQTVFFVDRDVTGDSAEFALEPSSGVFNNFILKQTRIFLTNPLDSATFTRTNNSGVITSFTLG